MQCYTLANIREELLEENGEGISLRYFTYFATHSLSTPSIPILSSCNSWFRWYLLVALTLVLLLQAVLHADFDQIVSPVSVAHFSQYKLMRLLIKQLEDIGFRVRSDEPMNLNDWKLAEQEILLGCECTSIHISGSGVTVTAQLTREGKDIKKNFLCSYVVGTDGAQSTVRKLMGIGMIGEQDLQKLISIHFVSLDLGQYLMNKRPGMLFFIFNTDAIGVIVAHDLKQGEFVLQVL